MYVCKSAATKVLNSPSQQMLDLNTFTTSVVSQWTDPSTVQLTGVKLDAADQRFPFPFWNRSWFHITITTTVLEGNLHPKKDFDWGWLRLVYVCVLAGTFLSGARKIRSLRSTDFRQGQLWWLLFPAVSHPLGPCNYEKRKKNDDYRILWMQHNAAMNMIIHWIIYIQFSGSCWTWVFIIHSSKFYEYVHPFLSMSNVPWNQLVRHHLFH